MGNLRPLRSVSEWDTCTLCPSVRQLTCLRRGRPEGEQRTRRNREHDAWRGLLGIDCIRAKVAEGALRSWPCIRFVFDAGPLGGSVGHRRQSPHTDRGDQTLFWDRDNWGQSASFTKPPGIRHNLAPVSNRHSRLVLVPT